MEIFFRSKEYWSVIQTDYKKLKDGKVLSLVSNATTSIWWSITQEFKSEELFVSCHWQIYLEDHHSKDSKANVEVNESKPKEVNKIKIILIVPRF